MEIKQGDKVRVSKDAPKMYLRGWAQVFQIREAEVIKVEDDNAVIETFELSLAIPTKYLVKVDAEAKEAKFKVGDFAYLKVKITKILNRETVETYTKNGYRIVGRECDFEPYIEPTEEKIKVRTDGTDYLRAALDDTCKPQSGGLIISDPLMLGYGRWDACAADLAKEIAVKITSRDMNNNPEDIAEHAVKVAKAVVEGLKKK